MTERYSKGGQAKVFRTTGVERLQFANADLVRRESVSYYPRDGQPEIPEFFPALFYLHKIAYTLFPENFIDVVGLQQDVKDNKVTYNLYSREAPIPGEHAIYSNHMLVMPFVKKTSIDKCDVCKDHADFHLKNDLQRRAREVNYRTSQAGILVPYNDDTDYCLTREGNVIFFEVDYESGFDLSSLRSYIENLSSEDIRKDLARIYVERYVSLHKKIGFDFER